MVRALLLSVVATAACFHGGRSYSHESQLPPPADFDRDTVLVGATVIPMDSERLLRNHVVVVHGDRIVSVRPAKPGEEFGEARVIDLDGKFLIPGLAEMHAHVPAADSGQYLERVLTLYVVNGVTTIRGMLGEAGHLALRGRIGRGEVLGPRLFTSGPSVNGNSVRNPDHGRSLVERQHAAGYDFVKLHPGLTRAEFDAVAEAAAKAGIPIAGHVSAEVGLDRALEARQATIDHLDGYMRALALGRPGADSVSAGFFGYGLAPYADRTRIKALAKATRDAGVWIVPTQTLIENVASPEDGETMRRWPEMRYMPANVVDGWAERKRQYLNNPGYDPEQARAFVQIRRELIRALHEAGAGLLLGSDAPQIFNVPGFAAHRELRTLVAAGLSPFDALRTGTVGPAKFFGAEAEFGVIAEGMSADLVVLGKNPLDSIDNVHGPEAVMLRGAWISREFIAARLKALAEP